MGKCRAAEIGVPKRPQKKWIARPETAEELPWGGALAVLGGFPWRRRIRPVLLCGTIQKGGSLLEQEL